MVARPPIEKWNRAELEDNYHAVLEQMRNYQKKNNELERKITQLSSKFRRAVMERKPKEDDNVEKDKYDQLVNENQLLSMKLKSVKHQLLTYTTPTARSATALAMTGRSTFRAPSTFRRPPPSVISVDEIQSGRKTVRPNISTVDYTTRTKNNFKPEPMEIASRPGGGSVRILEGSGSYTEKAMIIRLNRQMRDKNVQINSLQYELDCSKAEIASLNEGLARKTKEFTDLLEKKAEKSDTKETWLECEILRRELTQVREELAVVTTANERLVKQSLSHGMEGNEGEIVHLKKTIVELDEKLKETEKRAREAEKRVRYEKRQLQGWMEKEKKKTTLNQVKSIEKIVKEPSEEDEYRPVTKNRKNKEVDEVLSKLYRDVNSILESSEARDIDDVISMELTKTQKLARWQKMYSELYEEMEKVRNMLLLQHNINQKQTSEINLLQEECSRLKLVGEQKLNELKKKLEGKQKHIDVLQQEIYDIAYSGQKPVDFKQIKLAEPELSTRLSLRITGIKFANTRGATSVFMSLEFFDFELQTTPVLRAEDQLLDFTTTYDVVVSNLLVHYLQANGISIELYRAKSASYEFLAAGTVVLTELLGRNEDSLIGGQLALRELETGHILATLSYELSSTKQLGEALRAFRRAETAQMMIPLESKKLDPGWHELSVSVKKCSGLDNITPRPMEVCLVYELLAFSPFATENIISSRTINFNHEKKWLLPQEALQYFQKQEIGFYLMDRGENRTADGVIGMLSLPLAPLLSNTIIRGNFPMIKVDGSDLSVSLEVEIKWSVDLLKNNPSASHSFSPKHSQSEHVFASNFSSTSPTPILPSKPRVEEVPPEEVPDDTYLEEDIDSIFSLDKINKEEIAKEVKQSKPEEVDSPWLEVFEYNNRSSSEESGDTFTKEIKEAEIQDEEEEELEEKQNNDLTYLPPLPPVARPRLSRGQASEESENHNSEEDIRDHLVGFTSPLHHSIPPSDTSSISSPRREKPPVALPKEGGRSVMKLVEKLDEEPEEGDEGTVTITIHAIRNTAYSPLMEQRFEGVNFFVDWKFLDFPDEECKVTESQPLPTIWNEPIIFNFKKEYHLSKRKVALLEQYVESQNHMEFCLVSDAGFDSEELAVASLELTRIPPEDTILVPLLDVNGVRWADLEISLDYSANIFDRSE